MISYIIDLIGYSVMIGMILGLIWNSTVWAVAHVSATPQAGPVVVKEIKIIPEK